MKKIICLLIAALLPFGGEATRYYGHESANYSLPQLPRKKVQFNHVRKHSRAWQAIRDRILTSRYRKLPTFVDPPISQILPGLYLGADSSEGSISQLGIENVLCVRRFDKKSKSLGVRYKIIPIKDSKKTDLAPYIEEGIRFIDEAKGPVLVHCMMGHSRSAAFVIAYLIRKFNVPYDEAYLYVRECRPSIRPNPGFAKQLRDNESRLRKGLKILKRKPDPPKKLEK
jgi:protein-tyrosine phosphatase